MKHMAVYSIHIGNGRPNQPRIITETQLLKEETETLWSHSNRVIGDGTELECEKILDKCVIIDDGWQEWNWEYLNGTYPTLELTT